MNTTARELNFEVSVADGKYTYRSFSNGTSDALRYGETWQELTGNKFVYCLAYELNDLREGVGRGLAQMPHEAARGLIEFIKLPRGDDGKTPLPVPADKIIDLIAMALTRDRDSGGVNPDEIVRLMMPSITAVTTDIELHARIASVVRSAIRTAQARGARIRVSAIGEDDYAEASRAGHEAFMACLKDKGLVP